MKQKKCNQWST